MLSQARVLALWVLGFGLLVCWTLFIFFPGFPKSITGWVALVFVGLPLYLATESIGTWVFGPRYAASWPSVVRIMYGVVVALVLIALLTPAFIFVQRLIAS
jgi:hypothetical protein